MNSVRVDPIELAMKSGVLFGWQQRRPNRQLGNIYINQLGNPYQLGDALGTIAASDPEPYSAAALSIIDTITKFFGIGAGRKEADEIVPIQNRVVDQVIGPVSANLNSPNAGSISFQKWQSMLNALQATEQAWLNFLHDTQWSDGRAATQAEATLAPYFDGAIAQVQQRMTTASVSWTDTLFGGNDSSGVTDPNIPGGHINFGGTGSGSGSMLSMGASTLIPLGIGILAIYFLSQSMKKTKAA